MTFLFDDDVPDDLSHLLKHVGHRVTFLREALPRDTPDAAVLDHAALLRLFERATETGLANNINFA